MYLLLAGVFPRPVRVRLERQGVKMAPYYHWSTSIIFRDNKNGLTITTATRILVVIPSPTNLVTFFDDQEVPGPISADQVNRVTDTYVSRLMVSDIMLQGRWKVPDMPAPIIRTAGSLM